MSRHDFEREHGELLHELSIVEASYDPDLELLTRFRLDEDLGGILPDDPEVARITHIEHFAMIRERYGLDPDSAAEAFIRCEDRLMEGMRYDQA
jgi:hypothetical protein